MDIDLTPNGDPCHTASPTQRETRISLEAEIIARAEKALDAGHGIENEEMEAWLDQLDHDPYAPLPPHKNYGP